MKIIFLDKRCIRFDVQLGLFCAPDCVGLILYAQSSSRCVKRVSQTRRLHIICVRICLFVCVCHACVYELNRMFFKHLD